jgi:hypothetical protein
MLARKIHDVPAAWLLIFVLLSTTPELRVGDVQILELFQLLRVLVVAVLFAYSGLRLPTTGVWNQYGKGYVTFLAAALVLSLIALRLPFYPPSGISLFKGPFVLSLSRLLELSLAIYFMLAVATTLQNRPRLFHVAVDIYTGAGTLSALVSIMAFALFLTTGENTYFINDLDHRVRGFFNEGGPYGLFLTSVILLLLFRRRLNPNVNPLLNRTSLAITVTAWLLSLSKAGLLTGMLCAMAAAVFTSDVRKRLLAVVALPIACAGFFLFFQQGLAGYMNSISDFDETVLFRPNDRNLVMGRIVAAFVVPRMIVAHPVVGIGVGNYSLMRNDPEYLQGLPAVDDWDLPGLGLVSDAAELGIPLTLVLAFLLLRPLRQSKKQNAPAIIFATATFQPVALLMGVNLNFFYPWLVSALVIAWLGQPEHLRPHTGQNFLSSKRPSSYSSFLPKQITL